VANRLGRAGAADEWRSDAMKISLSDRSLYLKGLMLLIRKDREIRGEERDLVLGVGKMLGFDNGFCEKAIEDILHNKYVVDEPPHFSNADIARHFVLDALRIAIADGEVHEKEVQWVKAVALANGIEKDLFNGVVARALAGARTGMEGTFEAGRFEWD
jgi:hypothetical protein